MAPGTITSRGEQEGTTSSITAHSNGYDERLGSRWCSVKMAFLFLFLINIINYIDRGIIPGANKEFTR